MKPLSGRTRESLQNGGVWRDKRGVSAVEFALLAPIILLMYIGTAEIGNLLTVERRVETVASTAADLTAQVKKVSNSDLTDISDASKSILAPYDTTPLKIVLSSVVADQNNNGKVAWSYSKQRICSCCRLGICAATRYHRSQLERDRRRSHLRLQAIARPQEGL